MIAFQRTALAQGLVSALQGKALLGDAHNGLFLAAARRTGKSTFLQGDLRPALQAAGVVVYVDLWADARRDPGQLIAEAIARALEPQLGLVARSAKKAGMDKVKVGGLEVATSCIGKVDGLTLTEALRLLHQTSGQPVALIIDAAQHGMLEQGPRYRPYDAEALRFYRDKVGRPVSVALAQKALEALRQRMPALVWKSARGEYALEDAAMHRWFEGRVAAGRWPPQPSQGLLAPDEE